VAAETGTPAPAKPETTGPAQERRSVGSAAWGLVRKFLLLREGSIIVVTVLVAIYFAATTDAFLTVDNFKTLLPYFAPIAILAAGEVFLMINGEIDLSIGAVYLFSPFLFYYVHNTGLPLLPSVIVALIACMVVGLINGFFNAVVGIASFVVTLGTLLALSGLTLIVSHAEPVDTPGAEVTSVAEKVTKVVNGVPVHLTENHNEYTTFGSAFGHGTYSELIWAVVIIIGLQVVLSFTRWGIYTVSVGSNRLGAAEAGIRVRLVLIRNFILCSTCAGIVGILEAVRTTSAQPDPAGANEILFDGISAAVIGGTLLAGGSGTVVGALFGALFLGVLRDGLIIKGVNADYLSFYLGLAILLAMTINVYVQRVRRGERGG
jgi:simple sugar transport system permease protein